MRVYGLDFTSVPSRRTPITCAACRLRGGLLKVQRITAMTDFSEFEAFKEFPMPPLQRVNHLPLVIVSLIVMVSLLLAAAAAQAQPRLTLASGIAQRSDLPPAAWLLTIEVAASTTSSFTGGGITVNDTDLTGALLAMASEVAQRPDGRSIAVRTMLSFEQLRSLLPADAPAESFRVETRVSDQSGETRLSASHTVPALLAQGPGEPPQGITTNRLSFRVLAEFPSERGLAAPPSGPAMGRNVIIRDPEGLRRLFDELYGPASDVAPPAVNFEREMVVGVLLGERPTAGFSVGVTLVEDVEGTVVVQARETSPPADGFVAQVLTYPFQLAAIPAGGVEVRFVMEGSRDDGGDDAAPKPPSPADGGTPDATLGRDLPFSLYGGFPTAGEPSTPPVGPEEGRPVVIRDAESLGRLFQEIFGPTVMVAPVPVDFRREMVVGILLGRRPTAGFSVDIVSVKEENGMIVLRAVERVPGPEAIVAQVLTYPYQLVTIPASSLEVRSVLE